MAYDLLYKCFHDFSVTVLEVTETWEIKFIYRYTVLKTRANTYFDYKLRGCSLTPAPAATALSNCWATFVHFFIRSLTLFLVISTCWAALSKFVFKFLLLWNLSTYKNTLISTLFYRDLNFIRYRAAKKRDYQIEVIWEERVT